MRQWSINGDFYGLRPNGVARYAREVTLALDAMVRERHPLTVGLSLDLIAPAPAKEALALTSLPVRFVPEFKRPRLPQVWVQMQLPWHVRGGLLSFCNLAPIALTRQVVCIHDLHTRLMPESYGTFFRLAHRLVLPILGRRAAHITTVSRLSCEHLVEFGVASPNKITVTYNGSDHVARWDATRSRPIIRSSRPYVLCLGRNQKYKNVELLVRLAPLLDKMGLDVWMAGDIDPARLAQQWEELPGNLQIMGRIDDDEIKMALSGAWCFLFPSRIEGFGLPAVEAMAAGCPVIASTSPCLPEICGNAALYANPEDLDAWADLVRLLKDNPVRRKQLVEAGRNKALHYSWRRIAQTYLELMAEIDGIAPSTHLATAPFS